MLYVAEDVFFCSVLLPHSFQLLPLLTTKISANYTLVRPGSVQRMTWW
jgi:hypothetical protein